MAVTCEQVAALVKREGRAAVAANPDIEEHVGDCETCLDVVLAAEPLAPTTSAVDPLQSQPVGTTPPAPPAMPMVAPWSGAPSPHLAQPPPPPAAATPPSEPSPALRLPPNLPMAPPVQFTGRRPTPRMPPTPSHLLLGILGPALVGGVAVAAGL